LNVTLKSLILAYQENKLKGKEFEELEYKFGDEQSKCKPFKT